MKPLCDQFKYACATEGDCCKDKHEGNHKTAEVSQDLFFFLETQ